jgi:hypothetical protein
MSERRLDRPSDLERRVRRAEMEEKRMRDDAGEKLAFAGAAWIAAARDILQQLVAEHGEPGRRFSVCERFSAAPAEVSPTGTASWHFRIEGRSVTVAPGEIADADVQISADYEVTLPIARLVYTPEILARRGAEREAGPAPGVEGDMSKAPAYLVELHNRLAIVTA